MDVPSVNEIIKALTIKYHTTVRGGEWLLLQELRIGSGYSCGASRAIDFWALHCWPSKGHHAIAYEIKRSRGDFLRDVKKANTKHRGAKAYSDEFYYVAPPKMIKVEELPPWAGLIEVKSHAEGLLTVKKVHIPDPRTKKAPEWGLIVSLLRRKDRIFEG